MKHVGFHADRLHPKAENPCEVAFAKQWKRENNATMRRMTVKHLVPDCTERDAMVAATVIQWLGSNVGMCFLEEVNRDSPEVQDWIRRRFKLTGKQ